MTTEDRGQAVDAIRNKLIRVVRREMAALKRRAPHDTGNLANNAIRITQVGNRMAVYIDLKVAPYAVYTNEPWISPYWRGKKNPNENWWNNNMQAVIQKIAQEMGGTLE